MAFTAYTINAQGYANLTAHLAKVLKQPDTAGYWATCVAVNHNSKDAFSRRTGPGKLSTSFEWPGSLLRPEVRYADYVFAAEDLDAEEVSLTPATDVYAKIRQQIADTRQHYADGLINETEMHAKVANLEAKIAGGEPQ